MGPREWHQRVPRGRLPLSFTEIFSISRDHDLSCIWKESSRCIAMHHDVTSVINEITPKSAILLILDAVFDAGSRGSNRLANLERFSVYLVVSRLAHGELSYATYPYPPRSREIRHG